MSDTTKHTASRRRVQTIAHDPDLLSVEPSEQPPFLASKPSKLPETDWIEVSRLHVDLSYQHKPYPWAVERLNAQFNPERSGFICVNVREDQPERYEVIDGQTRKRVHEMRQIRWIRAEIYQGLTREQEAEFYLLRAINTQRQPTDMFEAECTAGRADALLLREILKRRNIVWQSFATPSASQDSRHKVSCIKTLRRLLAIDEGEIHLGGALDLILATWPQDDRALNQTVITSMFHLVQDHGDNIDRKGFINKLSDYSIEELHSSAQKLRLATSPPPTLYNALKRKLVELYNMHRQAGRRL